MNPSEFRLLAIWQSVVEMKNVQQKMLAYDRIASQVGVSDRSVRENIKKLVEQGYLVATDNWYALNLDCDFIKYIVQTSAESDNKELTTLQSVSLRRNTLDTPKSENISTPDVAYHSTPSEHQVNIAEESISNFREMFGNEADHAMEFFKKEVLRDYQNFIDFFDHWKRPFQ